MIRILDDSTITKIAAGEVIARPASVVKELLENSIDSGATEIKILLTDNSIKIIDNGSGMSKSDAMLCFKRHATSKISNENDLNTVNTLGFRGEALAAIAEISNFKLITNNNDVGTYIEVEAGKLIKNKEIGAPKGTTIEVNNLFFNVPVRKNYLKNEQVELGRIIRIVTNYALLHNNISIKLKHNDKETIHSPRTDSLLDNIAFVYGADLAKNLLKVDYKTENIEVAGYISKPSLTRSDKSAQSVYINCRYVKNELISNTIYNAYHTLLFVNRHPIFILKITLPHTDVDVNVHPTKDIVRIRNEKQIETELFNAIKQTFENCSLISDVSIGNETSQMPLKKYSFSKDSQSTLEVKEAVKEYTKEKQIFGPFKIFGQINKTYIIAENPLGLAIIDQHAAQERVNYEKFMGNYNAVKKQSLIKPKILELTPEQHQNVITNKIFLNKLFDFDEFGNNSVKLTAVPEIFGKLKSVLFIDIVNQLQQTITNEIEEKIIRFACKASVKAGDELTKPQMDQLLMELENCKNPYSCPHGRPTLINVNIAELEKKFKRSGW
ncbi:MAG: DNA mismatch repair endonuclease MutL [Nanoarchaeota archaeon]